MSLTISPACKLKQHGDCACLCDCLCHEPAAPVVRTDYDEGERRYENTYSTGGLTKREYFAALAMQGLISKLDYYQPANAFTGIAKDAVSLTDCLLAELSKGGNDGETI